MVTQEMAITREQRRRRTCGWSAPLYLKEWVHTLAEAKGYQSDSAYVMEKLLPIVSKEMEKHLSQTK